MPSSTKLLAREPPSNLPSRSEDGPVQQVPGLVGYASELAELVRIQRVKRPMSLPDKLSISELLNPQYLSKPLTSRN